jgi:hypothetical protein
MWTDIGIFLNNHFIIFYVMVNVINLKLILALKKLFISNDSYSEPKKNYLWYGLDIKGLFESIINVIFKYFFKNIY